MAIDNSGAPGNYGSKKSSEYRGSASGMAAAKKKAATKKTITTPGTKVSQKTINNIKSMGMAETLRALKSIGQPGGRNVPASKEFIEGARRMYGSRVDKYLPAKSTSADAARRSASGAKPASKASIKAVSTKPAAKPASKNNNKSNLAKAAGAAVAVGALVASKGKAAGLASKLSPAVGNLAKSSVGKAVFGTGEKLTNKAFSASGRMTAKVGKPVSQTQYEAMMSAAKAKGIKAPSADAARATATKPKPKLTKSAAFAASGSSNQKTTTKTKTKIK